MIVFDEPYAIFKINSNQQILFKFPMVINLLIDDDMCLTIEIESLHPNLHGAVLVCSVPPSGNRCFLIHYVSTFTRSETELTK